jgi:hypothetical protein
MFHRNSPYRLSGVCALGVSTPVQCRPLNNTIRTQLYRPRSYTATVLHYGLRQNVTAFAAVATVVALTTETESAPVPTPTCTPVPGGVEHMNYVEDIIAALSGFHSRTGLEVFRDFFARLLGWEEEGCSEDTKNEEAAARTQKIQLTTESSLSFTPLFDNKKGLAALGSYYRFMFGLGHEALEEWKGERKRRWKLLDILREERTDNKNCAAEVLGSYLAALFGWDDEVLKE